METKYKRGKELYEYYSKLYEDNYTKIETDERIKYAHFIYFLLHDENPFPLEDVYEILERAEKEGKRVTVKYNTQRTEVKVGNLTIVCQPVFDEVGTLSLEW